MNDQHADELAERERLAHQMMTSQSQAQALGYLERYLRSYPRGAPREDEVSELLRSWRKRAGDLMQQKTPRYTAKALGMRQCADELGELWPSQADLDGEDLDASA